MEDLECGIKKGREQTIWNQFSTNIMILEPVGSQTSKYSHATSFPQLRLLPARNLAYDTSQ